MKATKIVWAARILTGLICTFFAFNVVTKLMWSSMYPHMPQQMESIGIPMTLLPIVASLELLCTVLYALPQTAVLGALLFTGYLGGAMLTHLRVGQPVFMHVVFGMVIWLGIYLREPRLHALLPFRKKQS